MPDPNVKLIIEAVDKTKSALDQLKTNSETALSSIKASWLAVSAATAAAYFGIKKAVDQAKEIASLTNEIERQSKVLNMSVEDWQKWQFAAKKMSDVANEELIIGFKYLSRNMDEAARGSDNSARIFSSMGISIKDTAGNLKPLNQTMLEIMDKFRAWEDGPRKISIAVDLFGRSGERLIPLLNQGRKGYEELAREAEKLGIILSPDLVKKGSEAEDIFKKLDERIKATKLSLAPLALEFANAMNRIVEETIKAKRQLESQPSFWDILLTPVTGTIMAGVTAGRALRQQIENLLAGLKTLEWPSETRFALPVAKVPPPAPPWPGKEKLEEELRMLRAQMFAGAQPGYSIGTPEEPGLAPGVMRILTDEIEGYDEIKDSLGKIIELRARYREEVISIEDYLENEKIKNQLLEEEAKMWGLIADAELAALEKLQLLEVEKQKALNAENEAAAQKVLEDTAKAWGEYADAVLAGLEKIQMMKVGNVVKQFDDIKAKAKEIQDFATDMWKNIGSSFASNFLNLLNTGFKNIGDAARAWGMDMLALIEKLIMNAILFGNIMGKEKEGGGWGGVIGWASGLLKFKEGGIVLGWKPIAPFAEGGLVTGPTLGLVGEGGPEAVVPLKNGKIPIEGGLGGSIINVTNETHNWYCQDAQTFKDFLKRNKGPVIEVVKKNIDRNGPLRGR